MKFLVMLLPVLIFATKASAKDCRDSIVEVYASFGSNISRDNLGAMDFSDLGISVEEFNTLDSDLQAAIYQRLIPVEVIVAQTIQALNDQISQVSGTMVEFVYLNELQAWRAGVDELRSCELSK